MVIYAERRPHCHQVLSFLSFINIRSRHWTNRDESGMGREVERAGATDAGRAGRHCCGTQQRPDMKCAANV